MHMQCILCICMDSWSLKAVCQAITPFHEISSVSSQGEYHVRGGLAD